MNKICCIVSDLDGTLLMEDHSLSAEVISAVHAYQQQGGLFTIATGRPLLTTRSIVEQLGIHIPVILCNGAVIASAGEVLERRTLPAAKLSFMLIDAYNKGLTPLLFRGEDIIAFNQNEHIKAYEHKEAIICKQVSITDSCWQTSELEKVILIGEIEHVMAFLQTWRARLEDVIDIFQSEPTFVEIVSTHTSKGTAIKRLAELLHIDPNQVMAIGNQMNDLSMMQQAGVGVAVANSPIALKAAAHYVCTQAYGLGVIEAIRTVVQKGERTNENKRLSP